MGINVQKNICLGRISLHFVFAFPNPYLSIDLLFYFFTDPPQNPAPPPDYRITGIAEEQGTAGVAACRHAAGEISPGVAV